MSLHRCWVGCRFRGSPGAFEAALADGRVRCDNPTDFNTMLRLKEYLDGGPDSRKEVTAGISLESLQARYEAAMARERL